MKTKSKTAKETDPTIERSFKLSKKALATLRASAQRTGLSEDEILTRCLAKEYAKHNGNMLTPENRKLLSLASKATGLDEATLVKECLAHYMAKPKTRRDWETPVNRPHLAAALRALAGQIERGSK